jgi:hypothetical protein
MEKTKSMKWSLKGPKQREGAIFCCYGFLVTIEKIEWERWMGM